MKTCLISAMALGAAVFAIAPVVPAEANELTIAMTPSADNPPNPQMGDRLSFQTQIRNDGSAPVDGVKAWLSLVRVDPGQEHPVSLEDWSAEKAVTADRIAPGDTVRTDWPMRLIQDGQYRVVVSAASRQGGDLATSPFADFAVRAKPVVESRRVLPVALGLPFLLVLTFLVRRRRA